MTTAKTIAIRVLIMMIGGVCLLPAADALLNMDSKLPIGTYSFDARTMIVAIDDIKDVADPRRSVMSGYAIGIVELGHDLRIFCPPDPIRNDVIFNVISEYSSSHYRSAELASITAARLIELSFRQEYPCKK